MRPMRLAGVVGVVPALLGACGSDGSGGPRGAAGSAGIAGSSGGSAGSSGGSAGSSGGIVGSSGGSAGSSGGGGSGAEPLAGTPLAQIHQFSAPVFKQGHTLPPLTYTGCTWTKPADVEFETEMVEKYGYAYSLHRADAYWNGLLDNPGSDIAIKVAKNKTDPQRYKLFTTVWRPLWDQEEGRPEPLTDYLHTVLPGRCSGCSPSILSADDGWLSPAADPRFYDLIGDDAAQWFLPYKTRGIPLSVAFNLGEDDFGTGGGTCSGHHWEGDPAITADLKSALGVSAVPACDTKGWPVYASKRDGSTQQRITDKIEAALPAGALYIRYRIEGNLNRERYGSWYDYAPFYEDTKNNSSLPNMSAYYAGDEPPYYHFEDSAWDPNTDMVTASLASIAWQIKAGSPLSYAAVSGGWPTGTHPEVAPIDRYTGYLKLLYAAGNLGAVATWWAPGLFQDASGAWTCDPNVTLAAPATVPTGVAQYVALGEVHALFSHFEDFLRHGSIVPGPGIQRFTVTHPAAEQVPAYELVCDAGTKLCDRALRVVARKHDTKNEWIVVAFAATGADTDVSVDLPGAGSISVRCRAGGSLYHVTASASGAPTVELVDADAMHPTALLAP